MIPMISSALIMMTIIGGALVKYHPIALVVKVETGGIFTMNSGTIQ